MFLNFLDYFVGNAFKSNTDVFYKVRLLIGILASFFASVVAFTPAYSLIPGLAESSFTAYFSIALPLLIFWGYLLYLLKSARAYTFSAHAAIASIVVVLFAGIAITGGPLLSEVHPLLVVPMIVGFLLLGKQGGYIWIIATAAIYAVMVILSFSGMNFMSLPPESARPVLRIFNTSYAFVIISALIALYESLNTRITQERDAERDRFREMAEFAVESSIMNNSTDFLANTGDQLLASVLQQKTAIDELSATTEQLAASAMKNTDLAGASKMAITDVEQHLLISKTAIDQLIQAITTLQRSSQEIQSINNVINDIAYQTNLLSLNAMIEASRGSDNGGFKVVALEVKKLAERASEAAANINRLLKENFSSVKLGVELSENMRLRFAEIQEKIHPLATSVSHVANASREQDQAIRQITIGLSHINSAIDNNQDLAQQTSATANALKDNSAKLMHVVEGLER